MVEYKGKFLSDSKKISGTDRHTKKVIDKLQNYYGMAIRSNVGDLCGMMMAVQATLHHMTSTDDWPVHHMCPEVRIPGTHTIKQRQVISMALIQFHRLLFSFSNLSTIDWVVDSFCLYACLDTLRMQTNLCTPQSVEILPQRPVFWT